MSATIELTLPDFGDGDAGAFEAIVSLWCAEVGATLSQGDDLLEIVTDKASFVVPCPQSGVLIEKRVKEEERLRVGDVIGVLRAAAE